MAMSSRQVSTETTAQTGINAVEAIFLKMKWFFRRQLESDFGIDAHVEICDDEGNPSGQLIAIQVKSGVSYFRKRGDDFVFHGKERHLDYWDKHCLPVLLVLHNPEDGTTLWQRVERHRVTIEVGGSWSLAIPHWQTLTQDSDKAILRSVPRSDPESDRRNRMTLDAALIRRVAKEAATFVTIDEWVNKSLNFRGASFSFSEPNATAEYIVDFYMSAANPSDVFDWLFPWLEFEYLDEPLDNCEVISHVFEVKLNALGDAFLALENYYSNGAEPSLEATIDEPTGEIWDDAEVSEYNLVKGRDEDWRAESDFKEES